MTIDSVIESGVTNETAAESQVVDSQAIDSQAKELIKEQNFRQLREAVEEKQRRIQEMEARLHHLESSTKAEVDEFESLEDDDIVSAKQLKKLSRELKEIKSQKSQAGLSPEDVSRIKFKDYDDVVSEENVKAHLLSNPVLTQMVKGSANPYEAAYHLLKKLNKPAEKAPDFTKKLEEVAAKPRSLNEAPAKVSGLNPARSIKDIESSRQEALKRAEKYLGGYY